MNDLTAFLERNAAFVESFDKGDLPIAPNFKTLVICCVDARVVPAYFLGLEPGDALTMRTVGARLTDTAITEIAVLYWLLKGASDGAVDLKVALIGHTQCGMQRLMDPDVAARFASVLGQEAVDTYRIDDPEQAIWRDLSKLMSDPRTPAALTATGHVYDVTTGEVKTLEPS